jgi:hypothetical protein
MEVTVNQRIEEFFERYEARLSGALAETPEVNVEATAAAFTACFIEANPNGVLCGQNDDMFRAQIPKGFEFYRNIGTQSMKILSLDVTPLDHFHSMAKVHWEARYLKKGGSRDVIDFDVIYFLQTLGEDPKIFAYITGDEQKILRERGLIPTG